jgi:hypothetical protein
MNVSEIRVAWFEVAVSAAILIWLIAIIYWAARLLAIVALPLLEVFAVLDSRAKFLLDDTQKEAHPRRDKVLLLAAVMSLVVIIGGIAVYPMMPLVMDKVYAEETELACSGFLLEYGDDKFSNPATGQTVRARVRVTSVREATTGQQRVVLVQAVDREERLWVIANPLDPLKRIPIQGDNCLVEIKLSRNSFRDGYVIPDSISWE